MYVQTCYEQIFHYNNFVHFMCTSCLHRIQCEANFEFDELL